MKKTMGFMLASAMFVGFSACDSQAPDRPPTIRYGESTCIDCDMIISDERFASATIIKDARGRTDALLFDDVGDQIRYERENPELVIVARWVHDYNTKDWLTAEQAWYLVSPALYTPMASGIASFASHAAAETAQKEHGGDVMGFAALWAMPR